MLSKTLLAMLAIAPGVALAQTDKTHDMGTTQHPMTTGSQSGGMHDNTATANGMDKQGSPALCKSSKAIGAEVMGTNNEKIGTVSDLLIDSESGKVSFAVIDRGGVLGMGEDHFVVPTNQLQMGDRGAGGMDTTGERSNDTANRNDDTNRRNDNGDESPKISLRMTAAQLEQAPRLKAKGAEQLDAAWVNKTRQHFNVTDRGELIRASTLKKHAVVGSDNERLGEVDEIVLDHRNAQVAYCVIGVGGFAGLGERNIAVPWDTLNFRREATDGNDKGDWIISAPLTEERISQAPQYDNRDWQRMANPVYLREVYVFYDARPYWGGNVREAGYDRESGMKNKTDPMKDKNEKYEKKN